MDWLSIWTGILGGVGLFLVGMRLMTEGLRIAAGRALRKILQRWTATRMRALLSGVLITSIVQSSSAITVAVIGFANAGLIGLGQSVAVIYGSNVGTTITGWLVALVGLHLDVNAMALPAIGVGMALRIVRGGGRSGAVGEAIAGFGLFFLGIDVLRSSLAAIQTELPLTAALDVSGVGSVLLYSAIGVLLTVLMQSSSAAIAIILTSVHGGVVPIEAGACLVIGANVGTTSTAAIAALGATSNAKRVALAHVAFNLVTASVALITLPLLLYTVGRFRQTLGLGNEPAAVVAGFHTLFNLLGIALMWPLTRPLVDWLEHRFVTPEEEEGRPRYLDRNILSTPVLAVGALGLELARMGRIVRDMAQRTLRRETSGPALAHHREALGQLMSATGHFVTELQRLRLPEELGSVLPTALRIGRYYAEASELAEVITESQETLDRLEPDLDRAVRHFEGEVIALLDRTGVDLEGTTSEQAAQALADTERDYHALKDVLLGAGASGRVGVADLVAHLDRLSNVRRLAEQMERAAQHLWELGALASGEEGERPATDEPSAAA